MPSFDPRDTRNTVPRIAVRAYVAGALAARSAAHALGLVWPTAPDGGTTIELRVIDVREDRDAAEAARVLATPMVEIVLWNDEDQIVATRRFVGGLDNPKALRKAVAAVGGDFSFNLDQESQGAPNG